MSVLGAILVLRFGPTMDCEHSSNARPTLFASVTVIPALFAFGSGLTRDCPRWVPILAIFALVLEGAFAFSLGSALSD